MRRVNVGSLGGAIFGLVYVLVNTGRLDHAVAIPLRVLAVATFAAVLIAAFRGTVAPSPTSRAAASGPDTGCWSSVRCSQSGPGPRRSPW